MTTFICETCGMQYPPSIDPPESCPVCVDERQFVGHNGQRWISPAALAADHRNRIEQVAPGLYGIGTEPHFAIGQRALLVQTPQGNVLWDCISLLDPTTIEAVTALGGIDTIALSHPHFYTAMVDWAEAFNACLLLPEADRSWVMRDHPSIQYWDGEQYAINQNVCVIRAGGHFTGASVLHWAAGAGGRGALLTGDTVQVAADQDWASFMYSYPNNIPLPAASVQAIAARLAPYRYDDLYGGWWGKIMRGQADTKVQRSAQRYCDALNGVFHPGR
ncbi:MAG: hypothetical protein PF501_16250 [Salinisphaera sp.]|jgi:glyoxylase-like metal-dependent hydrolase (beta-lactamase superfamily II)|nr:hypothetical protein [Salinisphaera sp.]